MAVPASSAQPKVSTPVPQSRSSGARLNDGLIAERITTLLAHYWTAADAPEVRALQLGDWLSDLGEFGAPIVAKACEEWRRGQTHRPTPADIRRLCLEWLPPPEPHPRHPLLGAPRRRWEPAKSQAEVRANWREIPAMELTEAERALALPEVEAKMVQVRANLAAAADKRGVFAPPRGYLEPGQAPAREILGPSEALRSSRIGQGIWLEGEPETDGGPIPVPPEQEDGR